MKEDVELKLNLETAKNNPIGYTQWLAMELLKRAEITQEELNISIRAIKYLNRFKAENFMTRMQGEFEQYIIRKDAREEHTNNGGEGNGKI